MHYPFSPSIASDEQANFSTYLPTNQPTKQPNNQPTKDLTNYLTHSKVEALRIVT